MQGLYSFFARAALSLILVGLALPAPSTALAAASLTVSPITWNVIGLDSNNVNVGPNHFPVGARVCNTGDAAATNVKSAFVWDSNDPYINLRGGTLSAYTGAGINLNPGSCTDFYYEVEVTRNSSAYNHTRRYHITATADGGLTGSTPTPRELLVEHLVSQNRNAVTSVKLDDVPIAAGGTMSLVVGNTYTIKLEGNTATNGYEQIESFINFPNTIFQILSAVTTYSAETSATMTPPYDRLYGDACIWENDPNSPNYRACNGVGKAGGAVTVTYQIKILQAPSAPLANPQSLSTLIYDFSGSSYHYNSDYGVSTRYAYIFDPSAITISKNFNPDPTTANGISTLTFTLSNPTPVAVNGLNFTDTFPTSPGAMVVANPTNASTSGCGSPTFAPVAGADSIVFSNGSIAANSICTIKLNVTVPVAGTYNNTTGNLFINSLDTGNNANDSLTVNSAPAGPAPVCGLTMAQWTFAGLATNPPPFPSATTQASNVATAAISIGNGLTAEADTTTGGGNPQPGIRLYGWPKDPPINTAASPYIQFAIDTSQFTQVNLQFDAQRKANGPNNDELYFSTNGTTWTSKSTFTSTTSWATFGAYDFTGQTSATGITYFRVYGYGANATSSGNDLNLDNVTFTGCATPVPPTIAKAFSTDPIPVNGTSTLTFTVSNSNSIALSGVTFSDSLPTGVQVAATPSASTTCSGSPTWAPSAGATSLTFGSPTGATIPANSSCTVSVNIMGITSGSHQNVSGFISSTNGGTNTGSTGSATATLTVLKPPAITKLFSPNPVLVGGTSTLTFTVSNPNLNNSLTGVAFSDTYPTGVTNATPLSTTNSCSGALTATAGGPSIMLSGGSILAGGSCIVTISVTSASAGSYVNTSGAVSSTNAGTGNTASDTLTVKSANPAVALLKQISTSPTGPWSSYITVNPGTNIYYQFTVENIGDVPLSPIGVNDPTVSAASCSWPASLPAAAAGNDNHIATCVVGPISATSGNHVNTATGSGTYAGTPYSSTSSSARYATPGITLVKSVTETSFTVVGDVLHYSYLVSNSGFAPLLGPVTVTDDKAPVSCPAVSTVGDNDGYFDPGESLTCTATYTITLADLTAGSVTNTATASAGGVNSKSDSETVYRSIADLIVTKSNNVGGSVAAGSAFDWTITVNNTGVAAATFAGGDVILTDSLPGAAAYYPQGPLTVTNGAILPVGTINCSISVTALSCTASGLLVTLPVGGSFSVTFAVTPTTAAVLTNTATVDPNGTVLELNEINNSSINAVTVVGPPAIVKNFSPDPINLNGTSTLTFTITNLNATAELTGVAFSDPLPAGLEVASLPNASASLCGTPSFAPAAGDLTLTLSGATIVAGGSCTVAVDVTATTSGIKNNTSGSVTSANGGTGNTASDSLMVIDAAFTITKTADVASVDAAGSVVTYTVNLTNTGNVVLTGVTVSDPLLVNLDCDGTPGAPFITSGLSVGVGGTLTCSGTYTVTQADLDNDGGGDGDIDNTVSADTDQTAPQTAAAVVNIVRSPSLNILKEAATAAGGPWNDTSVTVDAGDTVFYRIRVSNTGNVTLTSLSVDDGMAGCTLTRGADLSGDNDVDFEAGEEWPYTCSVTAVAGTNNNTATADSAETPQDSDAASYFGNSPSFTITKTPDVASVSAAGNVITFTVTLTNTGNLALSGVTVLDPLLANLDCDGTLGAPFTTSGFVIAVGGNLICSGTYTVTQSDIDNNGGGDGDIDNTVAGDTNETGPQDASAAVAIIQDAALVTVKSQTSTGPYVVGNTITYDITVTNSGNVTLTGVTAVDTSASMGACSPGQPSILAPGSAMTCPASHVVTQADVDNGSYSNTATGDSNETPPDDSNVTVNFAQNPALNLVKEVATAAAGPWNDTSVSVSVGDTVYFRIRVSNTGNITLTSLTVDDGMAGCTLARGADLAGNNDNVFDVAEEWQYTCNLASAVGTNTNTATADTTETPQDSDDASYTASIIAAPGMNITKNGSLDLTDVAPNGRADAGDVIDYTINVQNTGNVALTGVAVSDLLLADLDCDGTPGAPFITSGLTVNVAATLTCTGSYVLTQNDLDTNGGGDGDIDNAVSAISNETGPDSDSHEETLPLAPGIDVTKALNSVTFNSPDEARLTYTITVQNTGNVTLTNLQVTDDLVAAFPGAASFNVFSAASADFTVNAGFNGSSDMDLLSGLDSLAVGLTGSISVVVDVDTGGDEDLYVNTAVGSGSAPDSSTVQDSGTAGAPGFVDPALTKAANVSQASVGDTVIFTITVTNAGNAAAPNVVVTDTLPAMFDVTAVNVTVAGPALVPVVNVVPAVGVGPAPYTVTVNIGTLEVTHVITIQIVTTVNSLGNPPVVNNAGLTTTAATNNLLNDNDSVAITLGIGPASALALPATGFAPGRETILALQPDALRYAATAVILEIPRLGVKVPIVGVPFKDGGWDVSWLGNQAGWLEGTAFPSWDGNSVLTGHVYSASGTPGPFMNLGTLKYGDQVIVHTGGQKYIFEIRSNSTVLPGDSSAFRHEELSWLTLITCKEYDQATNRYRKRVVVRAVLVDIE